VELDVVFYAPRLHGGKNVLDYVAGISDTLDGSSGCTCTYLPIVFQDDCQVALTRMAFVVTDETKYRVVIRLLKQFAGLPQVSISARILKKAIQRAGDANTAGVPSGAR
jgi:hypothetical protein